MNGAEIKMETDHDATSTTNGSVVSEQTPTSEIKTETEQPSAEEATVKAEATPTPASEPMKTDIVAHTVSEGKGNLE